LEAEECLVLAARAVDRNECGKWIDLPVDERRNQVA
jgi:hypothetical protein